MQWNPDPRRSIVQFISEFIDGFFEQYDAHSRAGNGSWTAPPRCQTIQFCGDGAFRIKCLFRGRDAEIKCNATRIIKRDEILTIGQFLDWYCGKHPQSKPLVTFLGAPAAIKIPRSREKA